MAPGAYGRHLKIMLVMGLFADVGLFAVHDVDSGGGVLYADALEVVDNHLFIVAVGNNILNTGGAVVGCDETESRNLFRSLDYGREGGGLLLRQLRRFAV